MYEDIFLILNRLGAREPHSKNPGTRNPAHKTKTPRLTLYGLWGADDANQGGWEILLFKLFFLSLDGIGLLAHSFVEVSGGGGVQEGNI